MDGKLTLKDIFKLVFKEHSYEILGYIKEKDIYNLRLVNKYIFDIIECHLMFKDSIKAMDNLFDSVITLPKEPPKSKFLSKFDFKNIMTEIKNKEQNKQKNTKKNKKCDLPNFNKTHAGFFPKKENMFNKTSVEFNKPGKFDVKQDEIIIRKTTVKENISLKPMNSTMSNFNIKKKKKNMLKLLKQAEIDEESDETD